MLVRFPGNDGDVGTSANQQGEIMIIVKCDLCQEEIQLGVVVDVLAASGGQEVVHCHLCPSCWAELKLQAEAIAKQNKVEDVEG